MQTGRQVTKGSGSFVARAELSKDSQIVDLCGAGEMTVCKS